MAGSYDRDLGMNRDITRRDFLNGVTLPVGGAMVLPGWARRVAAESTPRARLSPKTTPADGDYPPLLTGMRGSHEGSFEVGHQLRDQRGWDFSSATDTGELYDLVVVGGGLSGLAAAFYFQKAVPGAKVLILDNHDDFGGHAKRNEFRFEGKTLVLNGGTYDLESPDRYNQPALRLLEDIGVDFERFHSENEGNRQLYRRMGLGSAYFFDRETWGEDRFVKRFGRGAGYSEEFLAKSPLSSGARSDLLALYTPEQPDHLAGLTSAEKKEKLAQISYTEFLLKIVKVDPQVLWFFQTSGQGVFAVGADALPALFAWQMGQPGFAGMALERTPDDVFASLPGGHHGRQRPGRQSVHFPDGNATVARLLVRWLIAEAVPGSTMDDVATAHVDYGRLDRRSNATRIRLNSTVVRARHTGGRSNDEVEVSYVRDGRTEHVRSRHCVMACWNMMIPYIVPDLPEEQKQALTYGVKGPVVYTSIGIRNWTAFEKLGVSTVATPTMYHTQISLNQAQSLGDLRHAKGPEEPILLSSSRYPCSPGLPRTEQHRIGRHELLSTPFSTCERNIRDQLGRALAGGGFDPARDIFAITVNRWPHGYAYTYNSLYDPMEWVFTDAPDRPCVVGRQPFGSITIANSDAAASPHTDAAILEAHRAVQEILQRRSMPMISRNTTG